MDVKEIIGNAIKAEEESHDLYMKGAEKSSTKAGKELFQKLANEELKHKEVLQGIDRSKLEEFRGKIESVNFAEDLEKAPLTELQEIKDIMKFAARKEVQSQEYYRKLAENVEGKLKKLFEKLVTEEKKHEAWIRAEYNNIFG